MLPGDSSLRVEDGLRRVRLAVSLLWIYIGLVGVGWEHQFLLWCAGGHQGTGGAGRHSQGAAKRQEATRFSVNQGQGLDSLFA